MLTRNTRDQTQRSQDTKSSQGFDIKAAWLPTHVMGLPRLVGDLFQNDTEETVGKTKGKTRQGKIDFRMMDQVCCHQHSEITRILYTNGIFNLGNSRSVNFKFQNSYQWLCSLRNFGS